MKTSVVTGGASGIGLEFVKLLIKDNYKVFIVDKNQSNLDEIKDYLKPNNHEYIHEDLSLIKSPEKI